MITYKYERKLKIFKTETLNDVKSLHKAINQTDIKIRLLKNNLRDRNEEIEIKDETINARAVIMLNRAICIETQREALCTKPESVIQLEMANKMLRKFRINEAVLSTKLHSLQSKCEKHA